MPPSPVKMDSLQQFKDNLNVAYQHHLAHNYAVSVPICQTLLQNVLPPIMEVECHIMLVTASVPEALDHSMTANIIVRELLDQFPEDESIQELYDISQVLLRMMQDQAREKRNESMLHQQILASADDFADAPSISRPSSPKKQNIDYFGSPPASPPEAPPSTAPSLSSAPPLAPPISPARGHRRRLSEINSCLAPISEEPSEGSAPRSTPSKPVYRNRRPSSLGRAARSLAFNVKSTQGI